MSSEIFEKNIADLVRRAALPPDEARTARAREHFLRGTAAPSEPRSWKCSAAAAAALVIVTIVWSAKSSPPSPVGRKPWPENVPLPPVEVVGRGGNDALKGVLKLPPASGRSPRLVFKATSPLPEELVFLVRTVRLEEKLAAGRIESSVLESPSGTATLRHGGFEYDWNFPGPHLLRLEVSAPDGLQEMPLVKQLRMPESERTWAFEFFAWDEHLLSRIGPQLAEITDLDRETRDLATRIEAACANEELFKDRRKALIAEAERLTTRTENFGKAGLYPAASGPVTAVARDLANSMPLFKWEDGKFCGPIDYHADNKKGRTHRNVPFEFETLRKYLDEAVVVAGREFDLWILKDVRRAGLQDLHRRIVREHAKHPGVSEFVERLQNSAGEDLGKLELEIRSIKKDR
jgi:hypothetical protein